jgi:hypothetical protein
MSSSCVALFYALCVVRCACVCCVLCVVYCVACFTLSGLVLPSPLPCCGNLCLVLCNLVDEDLVHEISIPGNNLDGSLPEALGNLKDLRKV